MENKKEEKDRNKIPYEPPIVVRSDNSKEGHGGEDGDCPSGSSATGICSTGNNPCGACTSSGNGEPLG